MRLYYFEKLNVFVNLREFVNEIYSITKKFPESENYNLTSQLKRASVSALVNLAEGTGRISKKDQAHFTTISYSSLMEVIGLLMISFDQKYLLEEDYHKLREKLNLITNQLNAFKRAQLQRVEE